MNLQICHSTRSDVSKSDTDKCENLRNRFCQWYTFAQVKEAIDITPEFVATIPIPRLAPEKKKEIADLSAALKEEQDKLAALQDLDKSQKTQISNMKIELGKAQAALKESLSQIARLTEEASTKFTVSPEELKAICVAAIDFISLKNASKEDILALAQKRFSESDNVAVAWRALCEDSIELIDELFETLSNNNFELSYFDKFIKLESLLLLELAIKQALCTVAHKTMASSTDGNTSCGNFSVQG